MNIYIDLDDTLIHSVYGVGRNPGKRTVIQLGEDEVYHSFLRPEAGRILGELRQIGTVRMLTTATREYARAHNQTFSLGFLEEEIFSRDEYICKVQVGYGEDWIPTQCGIDKTAVLIDNLPPNTESSRIKIKFLGIDPEHYIQIREFSGKDPSMFSDEVGEILASISKISVQTPAQFINSDANKVTGLKPPAGSVKDAAHRGSKEPGR